MRAYSNYDDTVRDNGRVLCVPVCVCGVGGPGGVTQTHNRNACGACA